MSNIIEVKAVDYGLEEKQANELTTGLKTILEERIILIEAYKDVVTLEITEDNLKTFKELRLQIRDNRTKGIEKWHKTNKAYFLTGGRFVDAIKNKEVAENERMEAKLMEAEKYFENLEKERLEKLSTERKALILPYEETDSLKDLGYMSDEIWNNVFTGAKANFEAREVAKKKAEEERMAKEKAEAVEREKIRLENEKLKKEAKEKEARDKKRNNELRPFIIYIRDYNMLLSAPEKEYQKELVGLGIAKKQQEEHDIKQAEIKRKEEEARELKKREIREAQEAKLKAERLERERVEKELADRKAADEKAKQEEEARVQTELSKGDTAKVRDLINDLEQLKSKYTFKSKKNQKMYSDTVMLIDKVINHITK